MARTTSGIKEALLILEVYKRIPRRSSITSAELLNALVDAGLPIKERTLQRYLQAIVESEDFGVECDTRSRPYGYRKSKSVSAIQAVDLTASESLLLRLAQEHMHYKMPKHLTKSLDYLFTTASDVLMGTSGKSPSKREAAWLKKICVTPTGLSLMPPKIKPRIFDVVSESLFMNHKIDIEYVNSADKRIRSRIQPLGLVAQDNNLYLVCRFENHDDYRHLALQRMEIAKDSGIEFDIPRGFDLAKYVKERHFNFTDGEKVKWTVEFTKEHMVKKMEETPFNETQRIEKLPNGNYRMTAIMDNTIWLKGWAAAFEDVAGIKMRKIEKVNR